MDRQRHAILLFTVAMLTASCAQDAPVNTCPGDADCDVICIGCDSSGDAGPVDLQHATDAGADLTVKEPLVEPEYSSDPVQALCEKVVFLDVDCLEYHCTVQNSDAQRERYREEMLHGTDDTPSCRERAETDETFRTWLEDFAAHSCNDEGWRAHQCGEGGYFHQCDCAAPTNLGERCQSDEDCDAGDLIPVCQPASTGSYCYAHYCTIGANTELFESRYDDRCGVGNVCSAQPRNWTDSNGNLYPEADEYERLEGLCAAGCRSQSDCPEERACQPLTFGSNAAGPFAVRWCHYSCTADHQCAVGYRCADDGSCQFPCDSDSAMPYTQFCHQIGGDCVDDPTRGTDYCVLR